jgi:alpha-tubulin suppressor-like RCC1 family protein
VSSTLPGGLYLTSDGFIGGTPTAAGTGTITARASYRGRNGDQTYQVVSLNIAVALAQGTPPQAQVGTAYSYDLKPLLSVTGDTGYNGSGVTWTAPTSTLPDGLTLSPDGVISGTPTAAGTGTVTVLAMYRGVNGQQTYQVISVNIQVTLATATLPDARVASLYTAFDFKNQLAVTGDSSYSASKASFTATGVPDGLSLSTAGILSGTPTTRNSAGASFQVTAKYQGQTGQQVYNIVVNGQPLAVTQIVGGGWHTCAVTTAGGAKCWGANSSGQLGNGTMTDSSSPVDVTGLTSGVAGLSLGWQHSCALTTAGGVKCWGINDYGTLGNNSTSASSVPVSVSGLASGVSTVSAGYYHTCALTTGGAVKCWGYNANNQLGVTGILQSTVPVAVTGLSSGVGSLAAGGVHSCVRNTSGGIQCWGYNAYGELGNGTTTQSATPVWVSGLTSGVASVAVGDSHSCAVTTSGAVKCWGQNSLGQLGNNSMTDSPVPVSVIGLSSGVAQVALGDSHSCARTTAGTATCWGFNAFGMLGNGSTTDSAVPVAVTGLPSAVTSISAGEWYTCAVTGTGNTAYCWGANGNGQLGSHGTKNQSAPVVVEQ